MRQPLLLLCAAAAALLAAPPAEASFIHEFDKGDEILVKVNDLTSIKTQIPYSYYSLPFCKPDIQVDNAPTLWRFLLGDRQQRSPFLFEMKVPKTCQIVCRVFVGEKEAKELIEKVENQYRVNMALDNLPLTIPIRRIDESGFFYQHGYHIGVIGRYAGEEYNRYFIHNHLSFLVKYERDLDTGASRIVAFETKPFSIKHKFEAQWNGVNTRLSTCDANANKFISASDSPQEIRVGEEIIFTYDVSFQDSEIKWASRWDAYLSTADDQARWFSIVNSLVTLLVLSVAMATTMLRSLHREIFRYSLLETTQSETQAETRWKLVHGDVFRPPSNSGLLCAFAGSGVQLFGTLLITVAFEFLGFFSPMNPAGVRNFMILTWVLMGLFAGYTSSCLYKMFKNGSEWKHVTLTTAFLFPGFALVIYLILNDLLEYEKSSAAVPNSLMFVLVMSSCITWPLVYVGGYLGFKKTAIEPPVEINETPRKIPKQKWYISPAFTILIGSILPFAVVFIEFFYGLIFFWFHQFYCGFGFLLITLALLVVACAEISIAFCYYQLRSGNYKWWWRSFLTSGFSAVYLFLYATFFFFAKMQIVKPVSAMLYFGYMIVISCAFFLITGTIGFFSCFFFTRFIYSQRAFG